MTLLVATTNPDKVREIRGILAGLDVTLVTLADAPAVAPPEETGQTFDDNARLKALYYADASGLPSVAEDSGLEIDALGESPVSFGAVRRGADYVPREVPPSVRCRCGRQRRALRVRPRARPPRPRPLHRARGRRRTHRSGGCRRRRIRHTTGFLLTRRSAARSPRRPAGNQRSVTGLKRSGS